PDPGDSLAANRPPCDPSSLHGCEARPPGGSRCPYASGPPGAGQEPSRRCRGAARLGTPDVPPDGLDLSSDPDGADPRARTTGPCAPPGDPARRGSPGVVGRAGEPHRAGRVPERTRPDQATEGLH